jgi:CRISPR-associated protein Cas2
MHFVVTYDIVQDRRREKVMNTLKNFGLRVQYSVFECELTPQRASQLFEKLRPLIDPRRDRIHMYPLCDTCFFRSQALGKEGNESRKRLDHPQT